MTILKKKEPQQAHYSLESVKLYNLDCIKITRFVSNQTTMRALTFLLMLTICACQQKNNIQLNKSLQIDQITTTPLTCSVRALEVVNDKTVWFAGSLGQFGYTNDGGATWKIDSIKHKGEAPHFRSIAITSNAVFLLSIASPALLYKSTDNGENWRLVHEDNHKDIFYDSMAFWNDQEGIAMGDPTDGCLSVLITRNAGESWEKLPCNQLPAAEEGEAAFAASNSNISIYGNQVWIVSGGKRARVFHSDDKGKTWSVHNTPIVEGGKMTGIFTCDFYDDKTGILFGGNWEEKENKISNKAVTKDGGKTWKLVADGQHPGYRSSVRYLPEGKGNHIMAAGIPGISVSSDGGNSWQMLNEESFYTLRFGSNYKEAWVAGDKKIGKIIFR